MTAHIQNHFKKRGSVSTLITTLVLASTLWTCTAQADMVAYFNFEENAAGTTTDNVGSYVGTLKAIGGGNLPTLAPSVDDSYGNAYAFDGTGFIDGSDDASFQVSQGTVMAWYNAGSDGTESQIVGIPAGDTWTAPYVGLNIWRSWGGGHLGVQANHNGGGIQYIDAPGTPEGEWHHIAASYDGQFANLYVDGLLQGSADGGSAGGSISYTGTPSLTIGVSAGDGSGNSFIGLIDEVKLFNTALSESEIQAQMQPSESHTPTPATVFQWQADELGNWAQAGNWSYNGSVSAGVANNPNHTAIFADAISQDTTAVVISDITVNRIEFDNATHNFNIAGHGSVNLAAATTVVINPSITAQGNHQFQAVAKLLADTTVDVGHSSTLSFNNELDLMGWTLTKTGDGTLAVNNKLTTTDGAINVQQGIVSGHGTIGGGIQNVGGIIAPGNDSSVLAGGASVVPEPGSLLLLLFGMLGLVIRLHPPALLIPQIGI